jgi:hypothetical protein
MADSVSASSREALTEAATQRALTPAAGATMPLNREASGSAEIAVKPRPPGDVMTDDEEHAPVRDAQSDGQNDTLERAVKMFRERVELGDAPEECPTDIAAMIRDKRWNVRAYGYDSVAYFLTTDRTQVADLDVVDVVSRALADVNAPAQVTLPRIRVCVCVCVCVCVLFV